MAEEPSRTSRHERAERREQAERTDGDRPSLDPEVNQFYRAEMRRAGVWRRRLDQPTKWAVVVLAAVLTWTFSSRGNPHYVLLFGVVAVAAFLFVEGQRFREYDVWRRRLRVLQSNLYAELFDPADRAADGWRDWLGGDLRDPSFDVSLVRAVGHRLQHVYLPLLSVLYGAWALRVTVFQASQPLSTAASIGSIDGVWVAAVVGASYLGFVAVTCWSALATGRREFDDAAALDEPRES